MACTAIMQMRPVVYESSPKCKVFANHDAVMRFRDSKVPLLLGSDFDKIEVDKAICLNGNIYTTCNLRMNNLYSLKTTDCVMPKSIRDTTTAVRYLVKELKAIQFENALTGHKLVSVKTAEDGTRKAVFETASEIVEAEYDAMISTIPMPAMMALTGITSNESFACKTTYNLSVVVPFVRSKTHQTIYFPDNSTGVYRASLEGSRLILESITPIAREDIDVVVKAFGISAKFFSYNLLNGGKENKYGKILPVDDRARKSIIFELTDRFAIYSLGRFAIWKSVRTDSLINDIDIIKAMISSKYETSNRRSR